MNDTERTYQKYLEAVEAVTAGGQWIDPGVLRLALRLAVADAYAAGASQATTIPARYQRQAETNEAQIAALNAWLSEHEYALYASSADTADAILAAIGRRDRDMEQLHEQLAQLDADNTGLHRECAGLRQELAIAMHTVQLHERIAAEAADLALWIEHNLPERYDAWLNDADHTGVVAFAETLLDELIRTKADLHMERHHLREQLLKMDADNAALIQKVVQLEANLQLADELTVEIIKREVTRTNGSGNGTASEVTSAEIIARRMAADATAAEPAAWWSDLDAETNDWRISLDRERRSFRNVPKPVRLVLAQAFIRHMMAATGSMPRQADFDAAKPAWMPTATGLCSNFGVAWSEFLAIEPIVVTP